MYLLENWIEEARLAVEVLCLPDGKEAID